ncbi:MAG: polysaccharide biosynthesis C-terminal domain-containing protein [Candidatus Sabulitectum sp.]|nr:polysaccharide biosynthesis C-terminal domain-containing protein [Candidatus Sabulitectum sp.]
MAGRKANSAYMLMGQIFGKAGLFVSLMIYSRILDDGSFGKLLFAVAIGLIVIFLSDMGATILITRRIATGNPVNNTLSSAIILRTGLSILSVLAVMIAGWAAGYSSGQLVLILLVSTGFILDGFCETSFAAFRAGGHMVYEAVARAIHGALGIVLAVFAWKTGQGVFFAGGTYIIRVIPSVFFVYTVLRTRMGFGIKFSRKVFASVLPLLKAAVPLGLVGMFFVAGERLDSVFIKAELGDEAIAAYQQCIKILEVLILIVTPTLLPGALFAALCEAVQAGWGRARERIAWMTELFLVIAITLIIPLWAAEQHVLRIVWGSEFLRGVSPGELRSVFRIVLMTLPVAYIFHMFMAIIIAVERQKKAVPIVALSLGIEIILFLILIPLMGIAGAAISHLVLLLSVAVMLSWNLHMEYGPTGFVRGARRPVLASFPSFAVLLMQPFNPVENTAISMAAFIVVWLLFGGHKIIPSFHLSRPGSLRE